jgi:FtsP/CotA-like multicopper oxidase with cupredoxin domain
MTVKPHVTARRLQVAAQRPRQSDDTRAVGLAPLCLAVAVAALVVSMQTSPVRGQDEPTKTKVVCPDPVSQPLVRPPEFVSSGGILEGTINLTEAHQRLPTSVGGAVTCAPQVVRVFKGEGLPPAPPAQKPVSYADPIAGPTLRARVGDLIQLKFVNKIDPTRFNQNLDLEKCMEVDGNVYPGAFDKHPNCLHASSTANIHFHGTHTNPNSTGDNVYLQIRPLPRDNQGKLTTTPDEAMVSFEEFFKTCRGKLKNPLEEWPATWSDLPKPYTDKQTALLTAYQTKNPGQKIWDKDQEALDRGDWPIYYIGAYPYCFALPAYTAETWPPPPGSKSPVMGQAPGTHWYHAHKHGSTAINVANGMTGAFIIEGKYDDDLNAAYAGYTLKDNKPWSARSQPVLVLNQLGTTPNLLRGGGDPRNAGVDFVVNGRLRPIVEMQPGEIQLWRIVNTSARSAAYFMAPEGLEWRQLAQDGVQFADVNYVNSENKPFYMATANRVDLLVKAPMKPMTADVRIQNVMARSKVVPTPLTTTETIPGSVLLTVKVAGPAVKLGSKDAEMPFLDRAPDQPKFLADITDEEWKKSGSRTKTLVFNSKAPKTRGPQDQGQHTINDIQFQDGEAALLRVDLGVVEDWTVKNTTNAAKGGPGAIDHPLHIHINPFQIKEFFDPNEKLVDPKTGKMEAVPKYVTDSANKVDPRQCFLDPGDPSTWKPCAPAPQSNLIWWDVFAIPSARVEKGVVIPGYFKMRSRFVDYPGLYVMHCHILIHEDRGMMFGVKVIKPGAPAKPILLDH